MKKSIILGVILSVLSLCVYGEEEVKKDSSWTLGGMAALNLSQINLSNWAAGGENAIGFDVSFA